MSVNSSLFYVYVCLCACLRLCVSVSQVVEQDEHVLHLCAQAVVLQGELKAHSAQLESGDDALSQHLRDTQRDLEDSHKHSQECEMVISTMRDSTAALRRQVGQTVSQSDQLGQSVRPSLIHRDVASQ